MEGELLDGAEDKNIQGLITCDKIGNTKYAGHILENTSAELLVYGAMVHKKQNYIMRLVISNFL